MTAQPATIQVQYVNQPKPGKRTGSIKDANGHYWQVAPPHLQYFSPGQQAEILYDDHGNYQMVVGMGGQLFPKEPTQPQPGSAVPRNANWPGPQTQHREYTREPIKPKEDETAEQIFITGIVGRAMGSGSFVIEQIPELTRVAAYAWRTRHQQSVLEGQTGSPAHSARSDIDSQYGGDHPHAPNMETGDPGPFE